VFSGAALAADTATLRLQNSQYVSSGANYYREDASGENSSISVQLQREKRFGKKLLLKGDVQDEFSATENWNYLNVYQSYLQYRTPVNVTVQVGRKLETWSSTDEEWKQGIFQPRYTQNKLAPEAAGLTGVFLNTSAGANLFTAGVLAFVPDLGAHFWVEDHKLTSRNPWFDPPASRFRIDGVSHDIHYKINKPSAGEVVANPGVVVKVERSAGPVGVRAAGAYKPIPQLALGFPVLGKMVVGSDENYLNIEVTPRVVYHAVFSGDVWGRVGGWNLAGGLIRDFPVRDGVDETWVSQTYKPAWIWSALASRPIAQSGGPSVKFGLFKVDGGYGRDRGEYASDKSVFEKRFQYDEAYMAGLSWPIRGLFKSPLETEAKVVFDRLQNGGVFRLGAGYSFNRDWRVDGEMDLLGLTGERAQNPDGFLSTYRANDRMGLGMSYVF
jgi:hypothetical protein